MENLETKSTPVPQRFHAPTTFSTVAGSRYPGLESVDQHIRRTQMRLQSSPIVGVAGQQHQRYMLVKSKIDRIRDAQQELFLLQFQQFPETAPAANDGDSVWASFADRSSQADSLFTKLGSLSSDLEQLSRVAARESSTARNAR